VPTDSKYNICAAQDSGEQMFSGSIETSNKVLYDSNMLNILKNIPHAVNHQCEQLAGWRRHFASHYEAVPKFILTKIRIMQ